MHEISLVRNIFNALHHEFGAEKVSSIRKICVTAGILSSIEPLLMQNAFEAVVATESPEFKEAELEVNILPIIIQCENCGKTSEVENYIFKCYHCDTPSNNIIQGNELKISSIEVEE